MRHWRSIARIIAFQALFELEARPQSDVVEVVRARVGAWIEESNQAVPGRAEAFATQLVEGTLNCRREIDERISRAAPAFPVPQLSSTDRVILEMAMYEMLDAQDAPVGVVINEAVEIAKTFGGESSGRFVNGVLGTIAESANSSEDRSRQAPQSAGDHR